MIRPPAVRGRFEDFHEAQGQAATTLIAGCCPRRSRRRHIAEPRNELTSGPGPRMEAHLKRSVQVRQWSDPARPRFIYSYILASCTWRNELQCRCRHSRSQLQAIVSARSLFVLLDGVWARAFQYDGGRREPRSL